MPSFGSNLSYLSQTPIKLNQRIAGTSPGKSIAFGTHSVPACGLQLLALSSGSIALWSQVDVSSQPTQATPAGPTLGPGKSEILPEAPIPASSAAASSTVEATDQDRLVAGVSPLSSATEHLPLNTAAFSSNLDSLDSRSLSPDSPDLVEPAAGMAAQRPTGAYVPLDQCPFDQTHARECRVHIKPLVISASLFLTFENAGNLYTGYWYRC